jgi:transcriptional antiterminator NusG
LGSIEARRGAEKADAMAKRWYVLRVQTAREDQVKEGLEKRVNARGMEHLISNVVVPTEKVKEIKRGTATVRERKIYPGYVMVEMELNDDTLVVINETPGVGGLLGTGTTPVPMTEKDVEKMLMEAERTEEEPTTEITFAAGDRVRIKEGLFQNFDGEIEEIWPEKGQVRVIVSILGRPTPVELEYWQLESI